MRTSPAIVGAALEDLVGVLAAKVTMSASGIVDAIEILAEGTKSAPQLVRDVRSLLYASFRLDVHPGRITVAKVSAGRDLGIVPARIRIVGIKRLEVGERCTVEVSLQDDRRRYVGSAGAQRAPVYWRVGALATIDALHKVLGGPDLLWLEGAQQVEIAGMPAVVIAIGHHRRGGGGLLLGTSAITDSELEAAVRATLDAVNRRFLDTNLH